MFRPFCFLLLMLPFCGWAQHTISGRVLNLNDKKPVAHASVFLNNATVGSSTDESGAFILNGIRPGQYDLIVSVVGYETFHQTVNVNTNIILPDIEVLPKTILLNEVSIKPDPNWERNYATFKRLFFGNSVNAEQCKILNPELLDLNYDALNRKLTAKSYGFLEIENKALGYKIKYELSDFLNDTYSQILYFEGVAFFEELKGSRSQQRRWQKMRLEAFKGSSMHFLRSLIAGDIEFQGFKAFTLIRKANPAYKGGPENRYIQTLINKPLTVNEMARTTDKKGFYALYSAGYLYVTYNKKENNSVNIGAFPDNSTTIITFDSPYAFFDNNGIIINPRSLVFEGSWGNSRIAELLPVDYEPGKEAVK